jgi:hypothetical protein
MGLADGVALARSRVSREVSCAECRHTSTVSPAPAASWCLTDQYHQLQNAFPAAMAAAASKAAHQALGEGFGYNPNTPEKISAPRDCVE